MERVAGHVSVVLVVLVESASVGSRVVSPESSSVSSMGQPVRVVRSKEGLREDEDGPVMHVCLTS